MIDAKQFFVVVNRKAIDDSGFSREDILNVICGIKSKSIPTKEYVPGQETTYEDGAGFLWKVTRTERIAPDQIKRVAFVVGAVSWDRIKKVQKASEWRLV